MCKTGGSKAKLCPFSLGIAIGVTKGLFILLLAWVAMWTGFGMSMVNHIASVHSGYSASFVGGLMGGLWGLVWGFIFGFVVALIYDWCLCCCSRKSSSEENK